MNKSRQPIKTGSVELTQDAPDGVIKVLHRKDGRTIEIAIAPKMLERWVIRQLRQEVFA